MYLILSRISLGLIASTLLSWRGYKKSSLDKTGAIAAFFVGLISFVCGFRFAATLFAFYFSSSKLTKYKSDIKRELEDDFKEGGARDWIQVLSNSAGATVLCILYTFYVGIEEVFLDKDNDPTATFLLGAFLGFYGCCNGDTWASELGILSSGKPYLITTLKRVPKGTNGGVSLFGLGASLAGGIFIGFVFYFGGIFFCAKSITQVPSQFASIFLGAFSGLFGSLLDSFLGATFQYSGWSEAKKKVINTPSKIAKKISGQDILTNSQVNFVSAILTAFLTGTLALRL